MAHWILQKARRFRALSRAEQGLLGEAFLLLSLTAAGLRFLGLRRVHRLLAHVGDAGRRGHDRGQALRVADAVRRVGSLLPHTTCLTESLTLWCLLSRNGIESDLCLGVRKEGDVFVAHAWIELDGEALNEAGEVRQRFATFEGPLRF